MWNELLEEIREEILDLQLVDSYNQFTFTLEVTTEVDPLTFSEDTATPQKVSLILVMDL